MSHWDNGTTFGTMWDNMGLRRYERIDEEKESITMTIKEGMLRYNDEIETIWRDKGLSQDIFGTIWDNNGTKRDKPRRRCFSLRQCGTKWDNEEIVPGLSRDKFIETKMKAELNI